MEKPNPNHVNIEEMLGPKLRKKMPRFLINYLKKIVHESEMNEAIDKSNGLSGPEFFKYALSIGSILTISYLISNFSQTSMACSIELFEENCEGINTQFKLSPKASLHKIATTAESKPPESPTVTFFSPAFSTSVFKKNIKSSLIFFQFFTLNPLLSNYISSFFVF